MELERTFTFRNSKQTYSGIPIIVANMDTVGTFEMAAVMSQVGLWASSLRYSHWTTCQEPILGLLRLREEKKRETLGSLAGTELFSSESDPCGRHFFPSLLFS